jgi:hypothetical protein
LIAAARPDVREDFVSLRRNEIRCDLSMFLRSVEISDVQRTFGHIEQ